MSSATCDLSFLGGAQSSSRQLSAGQNVRGCFRELWRQWARRWRINTRNESSYSSGLYDCSSILHYSKGTSKLLMFGHKLLLQLVCPHKWGQFHEAHPSTVITWCPELGTLILGMVLLQRGSYFDHSELAVCRANSTHVEHLQHELMPRLRHN
jgi:hypothetical protein